MSAFFSLFLLLYKNSYIILEAALFPASGEYLELTVASVSQSRRELFPQYGVLQFGRVDVFELDNALPHG
jgi:hypothetical protein